MAAIPSPFPLRQLAILVAIAFLAGGGGWWLGTRQSNPAGDAAFGQAVRAYLLEHPEVLPEAMQRLQERQTAKQLAAAGEGLTQPFPGAVLGNPEGSIVLVEFSDFACGYCRASVPELEALIAANPQLKVVLRELPIIAPTSELAARWALAAAEQGKFAAFHKALFASGRPDEAGIAAAAQAAGLDLDRARRAIELPQVKAEIEKNLTLARQLRIDGTPSWVIGGQMLTGAVGRDVLQQAIDAAAKS